MKNSKNKIIFIVGGIVILLLVIGIIVWINQNMFGSSAIDLQAAVFEDAGVLKGNTQIIKEEYDWDDGRRVYEIEFVSEGNKYEYTILPKNKKIIERSIEKVDWFNNGSSSSNSNPNVNPDIHIPVSTDIGIEEAKKIATEDAGTTVENVTFTKTKLDMDDYTPVYDIDFIFKNSLYEYEIDTSSGKVYSKKIEAIVTTNTTNQGNIISLESAKTIALTRANLAKENVVFSKVELDTDYDKKTYDIEFYHNAIEYEVEIDAVTGRILEYKIDTH